MMKAKAPCAPILRSTSLAWRLSLLIVVRQNAAALSHSLWWTLDYDALIETDSHNDDEQEDKNDYREDDPSVSGHGAGSDNGHVPAGWRLAAWLVTAARLLVERGNALPVLRRLVLVCRQIDDPEAIQSGVAPHQVRCAACPKLGGPEGGVPLNPRLRRGLRHATSLAEFGSPSLSVGPSGGDGGSGHCKLRSLFPCLR
jgi:hypothetical protein